MKIYVTKRQELSLYRSKQFVAPRNFTVEARRARRNEEKSLSSLCDFAANLDLISVLPP